MRVSRRDFLHGLWFRSESAVVPGAEAEEAFPDLPPEFTPAMRRTEAVRLGLDVEGMSEGELNAAILEAMRAGAPGVRR